MGAHIDPVNLFRAWAEMVHRYVAGVLVLGCLASLCVLVKNRRVVSPCQWVFAGILLLLLAYQPLLGRLTVTLKLNPIIVSQHLLSGFSLMVLLGLQWMYLKRRATGYLPVRESRERVSVRVFSLVGIALLFIQLSLGAWTSTNYAALSCDSFPFCHLSSWPYHFSEAFSVHMKPVTSFEGGVLSDYAKSTIQVVHRVFASLVLIYFFVYIAALMLWQKLDKLLVPAFCVMALLLVQVALGIANVLLHRQLYIALGHTMVAAGLFYAFIYLHFHLWHKRGGV